MAALEIVMVAAAVLLLVTLFLYLWQRLGLMRIGHEQPSPPHRHVDVPPLEHDDTGLGRAPYSVQQHRRGEGPESARGRRPGVLSSRASPLEDEHQLGP